MDYVCKVVGEFSIEEKDFHLKMAFNEIVELSPYDFKASPRLREALRNREIEVYSPALHKKARRLQSVKRMEVIQENIIPLKENNLASNSEINELKEVLGGISNKMSQVVTRMDILVTRVIESNNILNVNFNKLFNERPSIHVSYNNPKLDDLLTKIADTQDMFTKYIEEHSKTQPKSPVTTLSQLNDANLNKLLLSLEKLLTEGIKVDGNNFNNQNTNGCGYGKINTEKKVQNFDEDIPLYVPNIDTSSVSSRNIVTESLESEGTESILEKLKKMK